MAVYKTAVGLQCSDCMTTDTAAMKGGTFIRLDSKLFYKGPLNGSPTKGFWVCLGCLRQRQFADPDRVNVPRVTLDEFYRHLWAHFSDVGFHHEGADIDCEVCETLWDEAEVLGLTRKLSHA